MRLIGSLESEDDIRRISLYLKKKGIETSFDGFFDASTGHMFYHLWGYEEDQILEAKSEFDQFLKDPHHSRYDIPITEPPPQQENVLEESAGETKRSFFPFTSFIIALCGFIFLMNFIEENSKIGVGEDQVVVTDVQIGLLYDVPPPIEKFQEIIQKLVTKPDQKVNELTQKGAREFQELKKIPFWKGLYTWILLKIQGSSTLLAEGPMFEKISQGQYWRLFSPAILHTGFLHILFNMMWVWILSRPIEKKIGVLRLFLLTLFVGVGSNTAQYLMGGPFFLGYSGVIMGLAGFTWVREKIAPWEGYPTQKATIVFLMFFVGAMFILQLGSFFLQIFTNLSFSPKIANTAHIVGGLLGALCGRLSFFSERIKSE